MHLSGTDKNLGAPDLVGGRGDAAGMTTGWASCVGGTKTGEVAASRCSASDTICMASLRTCSGDWRVAGWFRMGDWGPEKGPTDSGPSTTGDSTWDSRAGIDG